MFDAIFTASSGQSFSFGYKAGVLYSIDPIGDLPVDKSAAAKWTLGLTVGCGAVIYGICWLLRLLRIL